MAISVPMGTAGPSRAWQGSSARHAQLGLGAAALVLLAGSTYAATAMDGAVDDIGSGARLSAQAATPPAHAPRPAPAAPSPVAVAVPAAPVVDLGPLPQRHTAAAVVAPRPEQPTEQPTERPAGPRPAARPVTPPAPRPADRPAPSPDHLSRPQAHDGHSASDRYRDQVRRQMRAEMREEARRYVAAHWHMPMTP